MKKKIELKIGSTNFFFAFFLFFIVVIYIRVLFLSLSPKIDGINMDEFARKRDTSNIKLEAKRGTIYDSKNNILSTNVSSYTVIAYLEENRTVNKNQPQHVLDKAYTAKMLSPIINMTEEQILKLLNHDLYQVELGPGGRDVTEMKKNEIIALKLPGIAFIERRKRNYPNGDFASYILGYAKRYENIFEEEGVKRVSYDIIGELGIEAQYNEMLKGKDGKLIFQRDRFGYKIPDTKEYREDAINGNDIHLTIDSGIQRFLEAEVKNIEANYDPEWIQFTVMDAKTGAILGSSTTPSFNPNLLNMESYENPMVSYVYEPGSTMKTYSYLCAIDKGNYDGTKEADSGSYKIGPNTINDWNEEGWGRISYDKGYIYSSNTITTQMIEENLTKKELADCYKKYGFGDYTGVELPRELKGRINFNYQIEVAAASFGQGITTTAIQQLQAMSIVANNGTMLKPYIIEKIVDPNTKKVVFKSEVKKVENLAKPESVNKVKDLMFEVVSGEDPKRTGSQYNIPTFDIIGKTGTAQIYDPKTKNYLSGYSNYIYSFSGMYPKNDPKIIIYVAMKRPKYGKNLAITVSTKNIIQNISKYLNIFGEEEIIKDVEAFDLVNLVNKNTLDLQTIFKDKNVNLVMLGNGTKIINQFPKAKNRMISGDKIFILTNDPIITMPNLKGYSKSEVLNLAQLINLEVNFIGNGYVTDQSIKPSTILTEDRKIDINLQNISDLKKTG